MSITFLAIFLAGSAIACFFAWKMGNSSGKAEGLLVGKRVGYDTRMREQEESYLITKQIKQDNFLHVGAMVISLPNEWNDFVVGKIVDMAQVGKSDSLIPVIRDEISGEDRVCFGITMPYRAEMVQALLKLNPFERYSLAIGSAVYDEAQYIFDKKKVYTEGAPEEVTPNDVLNKLLKEKGVI